MDNDASKAVAVRRRIAIIDDHPTVRDGLATRIAMEQDLEICGEAGDFADGLRLVREVRPDVAVVDISLKTGNGIDLIKSVQAMDPTVRILVWSMYDESLYAERALRAGAAGYINKGEASGAVVQAIRHILAGKIYLKSEMASTLLDRRFHGSNDAVTSPVDLLSDRELETFRLIGQGLTTQEIAERMHLSPKTVESHKAKIKEKLNIPNSTLLVQRATRWLLENE